MATLWWSSPGWLWGLAAVVVPLAIHFLSRGTARRVVVGSVALLVAGGSRRARRIRFTDPLLAALRVLLLALVALALAGPRWSPNAPPGVWGLVDPELLTLLRADPGVAPAVAERLESLVREGTLRTLDAGLPRVHDSIVRDDAAQEDAARENGPADGMERERVVASPRAAGGAWSLLLEAEASAPAGTRFEIFTFGAVEELVGRRPTLDSAVSWQTISPPPTTWTARVTRLAAGVQQWAAQSGPAATVVASAPASAHDWPSVSAAESLRVMVFAEPERLADAEWVVAALDAIQRAGWLSLAVTRATVPTTASTAGLDSTVGERVPAALAPPLADVAIWLAGRPIEAAWRPWLESGGILLQDAETTRYRDCLGTADLPDGLGAVTVRRCEQAAEQAADTVLGEGTVPVWRDRQGRSLLSASANGRIWTLAGRFHPAWSDLVLSPAFPHWLAQWLDRRARRGGQMAATAGRDRRQAAAADRQIGRPAGAGQPDESDPAAGHRDDGPRARLANLVETRALAPWLWAWVAVVLVAERRLAARRLA